MDDYEQMLLWMEFEPDRSLPSGGRFKPTPLARHPDRVWSMWRDTEKGKPPALPVVPQHRHNAFMEDYTHDWNYQGGKLRFYTRVMDRSCWVLIEYKKPRAK